MFRITKLADYGIVVLSELAAFADGLATVPNLTEQTSIPEPTVSKVIKILAKGGLVSAKRGVKGGYRLERGLDQIQVLEVITLFEGPIAVTACSDFTDEQCRMGSMCRMKGRWNKVNQALHNALKQLTVADLMADEPAVRKPASGSEATVVQKRMGV